MARTPELSQMLVEAKNGAKIASSHSSPRPAQREKIAQCARPYASGHTHASCPSPMPCHTMPCHALPENEDPLCQAPKTTWGRVAHPPNCSSLVLAACSIVLVDGNGDILATDGRGKGISQGATRVAHPPQLPIEKEKNSRNQSPTGRDTLHQPPSCRCPPSSPRPALIASRARR